MLNRSKRKAIIQWFNCLLPEGSIKNIPELFDGVQLSKLVELVLRDCKEISELPSKEISELPGKEISRLPGNEESVHDRYIFIASSLNDFYEISVEEVVNVEMCQNQDEFELAKLAILVLGAVVHSYLKSNDDSLTGLTLLHPDTQEDIQNCIQAVLLKGTEESSAAFRESLNAVLVQQTKYSNGFMGASRRRLSLNSPIFQTPKTSKNALEKQRKGQSPVTCYVASPAPSPLKILLDSPDVKLHVAVREKQREIFRLRQRLNSAENHYGDLEEQYRLQKKATEERDKEIMSLKERVNEFRQFRDMADQLSACSIKSEESSVMNQKPCAECEEHKTVIADVRSTQDTLEADVIKMESEFTSIKMQRDNLSQENQDLKQRLGAVEIKLGQAEEQVSLLELSLKDKEEQAEIYKDQFIDCKNEIRRLQELPAAPSSGENLKSIQRIEELNFQLIETYKLLEEEKENNKALKATVQENEEAVKKQIEEFLSTTKAYENTIKCFKVEKTKEVSDLKKMYIDKEQLLASEEKKNGELQAEVLEIQNKYKDLNKQTEELRRREKAKCSRLTKISELYEQIQEIQKRNTDLLDANNNLSSELQCMKSDKEKLSHRIQNFKREMIGQANKCDCDLGSCKAQFFDDLFEKKRDSDEDRAAVEKMTSVIRCLSNQRGHCCKDCIVKQGDINALQREGQLLTERNSRWRKQHTEAESKIKELQNAISVFENEKESMKNKLNEAVSSLNKEEEENIDLKKSLSEAVENLKSSERKKCAEHCRENQQLINQKQNEIVEKKKRIEDLEKECCDLKSRIDDLLEDFKAEKNRLVSQNSRIMEELESLLKAKSEYEEVAATLRNENEKLHQSRIELERENATCVLDKTLTQSEKEELEKRVKNLEQQLQDIPEMHERKKVKEFSEKGGRHSNAHKKECDYLRMCMKDKECKLNESLMKQKEYENKLESLSSEMLKINSDLNFAEEQKSCFEATCQQFRDQISQLQNENESFEKQRVHFNCIEEQLKQEVSDLSGELSKLRSDVNLAEECKSHHENICSELRDQVSQLQSKNESLEKQSRDFDLIEKQQKQEILDLSSEMSKIKSELNFVEEQQSHNKDTCQQLNDQITQLRNENEALAKQIGDFESIEKQLKQEIVHLHSRNEQVEKSLWELRNECDNIKITAQERLLEHERALEECKQNLAVMTREKDDVCADFDKHLVECKEGKTILESKLNEAEEEIKTIACENYKHKFEELQSTYNDHLSTCNHETSSDGNTCLAEKVGMLELEKETLNSKNSALEAEKESLIEKIEDIERDLLSLSAKNKLDEEEYCKCIEQKENRISKLENQVLDLIEEVKANEIRIHESVKNNSNIERLTSELNETNEKLSNGTKKLQNLQAESLALKEKLRVQQVENKKLRHELDFETKKVKEEMAGLTLKMRGIKNDYREELSKLSKENTNLKDQCSALESRVSKRENAIAMVEADKEKFKMQLKKDREELESARVSVASLKERVAQLEIAERRTKAENSTKSTQLQLATNLIKQLRKEAEKNDTYVSAGRRFSNPFAGSPDVRKKPTVKVEKVAKKTQRQSIQPIIVKKNTEKSSTMYLLPASETPQRLNFSSSFNGSITSDGFNHSLLGPGGHFFCDDEEEYLNHSSLEDLMPKNAALPASSSKRISELQRRNTLCLPHLKSSYPIEMQVQPPTKCSDDSMREGFGISEAGDAKEKEYHSCDSPKRKRADSTASVDDFRKRLKEAEAKSFNLRDAIHIRADGSIGNPFPAPGMQKHLTTSKQLKKIFAKARYERELGLRKPRHHD